MTNTYIYIYIDILGSIISYNHQSHNWTIIFPVLGVFKIPNRGFHLMDGTTAPSTWWQAPLAKWRGQQKDRNRRNQLDYWEGQMLVGLWNWKVKHEDKDRQMLIFVYFRYFKNKHIVGYMLWIYFYWRDHHMHYIPDHMHSTYMVLHVFFLNILYTFIYLYFFLRMFCLQTG